MRNFVFETSEAPLSSILKNWQKSLFFHEYLPKGLTNFGRSESKLHTLNYHTLNGLWDLTRFFCQIYVWIFDSLHPKLVSTLGKYSWKKSDFCQFFKIEEVSKTKFLTTEGIKIWTQNSNSWVKTIHIFSFKFLNWWTIILKQNKQD